MKYLQTYNIFEKSSLTSLGVPNEVMVHIQKNYEIPSEIEWEKIRYKKDFSNEKKNGIFSF